MKSPENSNYAPLCFTARQTAELLNVSIKTVRRLCERGLLHRSSALRTLLIPRTSIEDFLRAPSK
jgi:hypothetical protein